MPATPKTAERRPGSVWALAVFLAVQAVGAIAGGIGLIQDPVENIGMPLSFLLGVVILLLALLKPTRRFFAR